MTADLLFGNIECTSDQTAILFSHSTHVSVVLFFFLKIYYLFKSVLHSMSNCIALENFPMVSN